MEKDKISKLLNYYQENKGKCIGSLLGLIAAIMILVIGFFKTLFIFLFIFIGYYLGRKFDEGLTMKEIIINLINFVRRDYM